MSILEIANSVMQRCYPKSKLTQDDIADIISSIPMQIVQEIEHCGEFDPSIDEFKIRVEKRIKEKKRKAI